MKTIFPKEFLTNSIEYHRHQYLKKSQYIYFTLIVGLVIFSFLLPFITIDLYSSSPGMIRSKKQRNIVKSPVNGKVETVNVKENSIVQAGDTLFVLDTQHLNQNIQNLHAQSNTLGLEIKDLEYLLNHKTFSLDSLRSDLIRSQFEEHLINLKSLEDQLYWNAKDFNRQEKLFQLGVIARKSFEASQLKLRNIQNNLTLYQRKTQKNWQRQLYVNIDELKNVNSKLREFQLEKSKHFILAPLEGTVIDLIGIDKNNFVYTGASIAHISPQTDLVVECFVNPADIGLIKKKHPVSFQIDAFDHNYWGAATGEITEISEDHHLLNDMPMFKVICSLNEKKLDLNKNIQGKLKKGMTLNAHFFIKSRTALQLVFDTINDWH